MPIHNPYHYANAVWLQSINFVSVTAALAVSPGLMVVGRTRWSRCIYCSLSRSKRCNNARESLRRDSSYVIRIKNTMGDWWVSYICIEHYETIRRYSLLFFLCSTLIHFFFVAYDYLLNRLCLIFHHFGMHLVIVSEYMCVQYQGNLVYMCGTDAICGTRRQHLAAAAHLLNTIFTMYNLHL